ncbi:endolysin [Mycobacterium phage Anthony]|uniref:Lysin A n=1 Tax=Mycobacterium phage Anthony TaxID=2599857 RepID=A0A5J6THN7_9CAUD|nr:endolysin [Mycobacterium phage Anthony]QFG10381.1 lysin A [Mycobacterium phage Anthony]
MTAVVTRQRAQQVHDMARARAGLPYAYGGAFTNDPKRSTDCSGLVMQTAAWYMGRTDWVGNRYGSTESFRLDYKIVYDLGFKRLPPGGIAALGFTPVMLVGLQHGGGGMYSHTACTLMTMDYPGGPVKVSKRGVDWESHGNRNGVGVDLYDGARAWNDPLFHDFWYLDAKLEDAPTSGDEAAATLSEATGLSLQRASEILPAVRDGLVASDCTNANRIAMWLAQVGHESVSFNYTEEIAKNGRYAPYIGRTWIQITWDYNYRAFSEWCFERGLVTSPDYFVRNYTDLALLKWAGLGAAWYWTQARGTQINDASDRRDLYTVTQLINGGQNGAADRKARYHRASALGDRLLSLIADAPTTDTFEELLMMEVESFSIYADPGEPKIPLYVMLQSLDAHGPHEPYVEAQARIGHADSIRRVVRTAAGKGKYGTAPGPVNQASRVLAELEASGVLAAYLKGTA